MTKDELLRLIQNRPALRWVVGAGSVNQTFDEYRAKYEAKPDEEGMQENVMDELIDLVTHAADSDVVGRDDLAHLRRLDHQLGAKRFWSMTRRQQLLVCNHVSIKLVEIVVAQCEGSAQTRDDGQDQTVEMLLAIAQIAARPGAQQWARQDKEET
jgi:hypothetical protein